MPVTRRFFFFGTFALPVLGADKPVRKPNVLLISTENLPSWVLGCYGNKEIRTPNLDRLGQLGTRFQRHTSCAPVPGLGRTAMLTGRTPMQLGGSATPAAGVPALEKLLGDAGYQCSTVEPAGAAALLDAAAPSKPFFLHVTCPGPRAPYDGVPEKFKDMYAQVRFETFSPERLSPRARSGKEMLADMVASQRLYAAAVTALDDQVQTIIGKVYQRKLQDDTAIVFTSTCGALLGRHGVWGAADSSEPPNMYEESVTTPLLWSWVGDVPAQAVRPEVVSTYDLLPTVLDIAEAGKPPANLCGRSYRALVTGKPLPPKEPWRTTVFAHYANTDMAREERYKAVLRDQGKGPGELYDLRTDPGESLNQYNNPEFVTVRNSLTAELNGWRQKYSA